MYVKYSQTALSIQLTTGVERPVKESAVSSPTRELCAKSRASCTWLLESDAATNSFTDCLLRHHAKYLYKN